MAAVEGIDKIKQVLKQRTADKQAALARGLAKAALFIQRESMKLVPVDYGFLKASAFTRLEGDGTPKPKATVGYTSEYAIYVHEVPPTPEKGKHYATHGAMWNAKHAADLAKATALRKAKKGGTTGPYRHDRGPDQQYKFLEAPFRDHRDTVKAIILAEVQSA